MLRATLKSLLSRKLRLVLSGFAVILGVMFVAGALVLTDTLGRSFDNLFTDIYADTDIQVTKVNDVPDMQGNQTTQEPIAAAVVAKVQAVPGVAKATGNVFTDGARIIGKNGKILPSTGAPRFGAGWNDDNDTVILRDGRKPTAPNEIVLSALAAKKGDFAIGDQVSVLTKEPKQTFTVVGISAYKGGRDSLAGETSVFFTMPVAQRLMLQQADAFNGIDVTAADGVSLTELRDRVAAALGDASYKVQTGDELASESSKQFRSFLKYFNYLLLGFAGVALFVGVFLILNTFSIIVAQRTQELALFRAVGASRRQMIGSVLTEAIVIGLLASIVGLLLGIGIGALLGTVLGNFLGGGELRLAGLGVPVSAVIASFVVGIGITVVAALLPAIRASNVPPVAAMRESATPDRPLTRITIMGAIVTALGGTLLLLGLTGSLGDGNLYGVLGGVLLTFTGVALLTPLISRPVVRLLGAIFRGSAPGQIGRRNSARNPRRTAITAAALMVSIALVTGISVVFSSIRVSAVDAIDNGINADLVVASEAATGQIAFMDPQSVTQMRALPGAQSVVSLYVDGGLVNGRQQFLGAVDDTAANVSMFELKTVSGRLDSIPAGSVVVDSDAAKSFDVTTGSQVTIQMAKGGPQRYTIAGVYERSAYYNGFLVPLDAAKAGFRTAQPTQAYVKVASGTPVATVQQQIDQIIKDSPEVTVQTLDSYVAQFTQIFNFVLIFVQILLALAMIIAVLGIINTLALSMIERTRELGLLRAVGMKRGQVTWMISVESVVISVFGAVLGIVVGIGLGAAVFVALRDQGFTKLAMPWTLMVIYLIASVIVGFVAAIVPAIRAARLDVLRAIAYE